MNTKVLKRKNIDIPEDVFQSLSAAAALRGKNLKNFIEDLLIHFAQNNTDEILYNHMLNSNPEGKEYLNSEEKKEFEDFLGV